MSETAQKNDDKQDGKAKHNTFFEVKSKEWKRPLVSTAQRLLKELGNSDIPFRHIGTRCQW